jgi:sulfate permease, SulP family
VSILNGFGAMNRLAAMVPAGVALGLLALGPAALGLVPRPVLAALLLSFGIEQMVLRTWRESRRLPWHEAAILLVVAVTMATVGIVEGLGLGLGLALLIFVWTYSKVPVIRSILRGDEMRSSVTRTGAALRMLEREGHCILLFRLQGYMFFLNAQSVQQAFASRVAAGARYVILDFQHVLGLDSSAVDAFRRLEQDAVARRVTLVLSGVRPALAERFAAQGVFRTASRPQNADRALEDAEERLLAEHGAGGDDQPVSLAAFLSSHQEVPDFVQRLEPFIERVSFAPGESVMRQGEVADDMLFLERGRVAATLQEQGRPVVHLRTLTAGTVVGEIALVRGGRRTASVTAETPCEGVRLTRAALTRMEGSEPALAIAVHRTVMLQLADKLADNTRAVDLALR